MSPQVPSNKFTLLKLHPPTEMLLYSRDKQHLEVQHMWIKREHLVKPEQSSFDSYAWKKVVPVASTEPLRPTDVAVVILRPWKKGCSHCSCARRQVPCYI